MTTDEAHGAYVLLSETMVLLSEGKPVTLNGTDLDWLERIYLLLPELPLKDREAA